MATKAIAEDFHFSMSIGKGLFTELISAALPMKLIGGEFTLADALRDGARQLQVKQRVAGLLEAPENTALLKVRDKARETWGARRGQVYEIMDRLVQVDGDWEIQLDREGIDADALMEAALDAGAEDVEESEDTMSVVTAAGRLESVAKALTEAGFTPAQAEISMVPSTTVALKGAEAQTMLSLADALEDLDDVQGVHANFDISDEDMASFA